MVGVLVAGRRVLDALHNTGVPQTIRSLGNRYPGAGGAGTRFGRRMPRGPESATEVRGSVTPPWHCYDMARMFRRFGGSQRVESDDDLTVGYERRELSAEAIRRKGWPPDLAAVRQVLPEHLHESDPPAPARRGLWPVVATSRGHPIGLAWAVPWVGDDWGVQIEEVAVLTSWQRQGIGGQLVRQTAQWVHELGFRTIFIYPVSGTGWVTRLGFSPAGGAIFAASTSALI